MAPGAAQGSRACNHAKPMMLVAVVAASAASQTAQAALGAVVEPSLRGVVVALRRVVAAPRLAASRTAQAVPAQALGAVVEPSLRGVVVAPELRRLVAVVAPQLAASQTAQAVPAQALGVVEPSLRGVAAPSLPATPHSPGRTSPVRVRPTASRCSRTAAEYPLVAA